MRNLFGKIRVAFMVVLILAVLPAMKIYAASATVSVSSATAANGEQVTITISVNGDEAIAMTDLWLSYDASILEYVSGADVGGGGSIRLISSDNTSFKVVFKAVNAGTSAISVNTAQSMVGSLYTDTMSLSASNGSVTVKAPATYSSDNNLASLSISPGTLTPAFSPDVTTYNTSVPADCSRLVISATTSDSKAKISTWGAALDPGDNTTKITVTAEDGSKKVYTIYTKRPIEQATAATEAPDRPTQSPSEEPKNDVVVTINGQDYFILSNFDESVLPEGYEAADYTYKGNAVVVGKGLSNGLTIFYLETATESESKKSFFVYDESADSFSALQRLNSRAREYTILNEGMTALPDNYVSTRLDFNGQQIDVWVENVSQPQYFLFYGMSVDGRKNWYQYDLNENTIQNAIVLEGMSQEAPQEGTTSEEPTAAAFAEISGDYQELKSQHEQYVSRMKMIVCILLVLLVAVIVMFILFVIRSFSRAGTDERQEVMPEGRERDDEYNVFEEEEEPETIPVREKEGEPGFDKEILMEDDLVDLCDIDISEDFSFIDLDDEK